MIFPETPYSYSVAVEAAGTDMVRVHSTGQGWDGAVKQLDAIIQWRDGTVRTWDVASRKEVRSFPGQPGPVLSLAFTPDGKTLAAGGRRSVRLIAPADGQEILPRAGHHHMPNREVPWCSPSISPSCSVSSTRLQYPRRANQAGWCS